MASYELKISAWSVNERRVAAIGCIFMAWSAQLHGTLALIDVIFSKNAIDGISKQELDSALKPVQRGP